MGEDTRIGTEIAGYRIDRLIGRGGMSVVYLAEHLRLGRKVALKVLATELAQNEGFRERFLRESQVAASIDHPNIVPIYDADDTEGLLYIAMRYVEGTDLKGLIRSEAPIDPIRTARIVSQIASALDAAHANGLVHRDVKPGNVLLTTEEHVYVSDFGLTKRALSVSGLTRTGQLVGTIDYVAPEQIKGDPIDGRADVYSLGCVLFECLTGKVPYERDIEVASLWAHVQEPPPKATDIERRLPKEIDGVIADAMAKDPLERTASPGQVASELRWALGLEAPSASGASGPRSRPRVKTKHRSRATLVALAVGVMVAVITVGVFLLSRGGSSGGFVPGANTVARIDSATNSFGEPIPSGGQDPTGVAIDENGDIWVINRTSSTVTRIDGQTLAAGPPTSTRGTPTGIAAGEGAVWITNSFGGESGTPQVVQVNLADGVVSPAFESPTSSEIVVAFGSIWLADGDRDRVLRYDPEDLSAPPRPIATDDDPELQSDPSYLAVGTEAVPGIWVVNQLGGTVVRIDPETNTAVDTFTVDQPTAVAAAGSEVWVTSHENDSVKRIDATTGGTERTLTLTENGIPNGPTTIVVGKDDQVWVASDLERVVSRIDPTTNEAMDPLKLGGIAGGISVDLDGNVWVTVHVQQA